MKLQNITGETIYCGGETFPELQVRSELADSQATRAFSKIWWFFKRRAESWKWNQFLRQKPLESQIELWESKRGTELIQEMGLDVCGNGAAPNVEKN